MGYCTVIYTEHQGNGPSRERAAAEMKCNPALLTIGIRKAFAAGLGLAVPTGPNELGWAMESTNA